MQENTPKITLQASCKNKLDLPYAWKKIYTIPGFFCSIDSTAIGTWTMKIQTHFLASYIYFNDIFNDFGYIKMFFNGIWKKKQQWGKAFLKSFIPQFQNRQLSVEVFSAISQLIIHICINTLQLVTTTSSRDLCPRGGINMTTTQKTLPQASQNWINTMSNEQMGFQKLTSKMTLEHDICTSKEIRIWLHRRMKFSS